LAIPEKGLRAETSSGMTASFVSHAGISSQYWQISKFMNLKSALTIFL